MIGYFYNDVLVIISILGSTSLFIGSFPHTPFKPIIGLAETCNAPVIFGTFFQSCLILTGLAAEMETVVVLARTATDLVTGLFALSLVLPGGHW